MQIKRSKTRLLQWFHHNNRKDLPWRKTDNIYHIYISEIMLQQTQTSRVATYFYPQFLKRFPTLQTLADATIEEVLALWSGLGYYSRAKNLHKCAKLCCKNGLPNTPKKLLQLPGIGKYTAHAICSFGYNQKVPVVDTNIARVLKRFFALKEPSEADVWEKAKLFLNSKNPKEHNLALMDLGATTCSQKKPKCTTCPLELGCQGKSNPTLFTKTKKSKYEEKTLYLGVCTKDEKVALYTSSEKLYNNLLVLPHTNSRKNLLRTIKHSYTKYRLKIFIYKIQRAKKGAIWVDLDKLASAPISSLTKKALGYLSK